MNLLLTSTAYLPSTGGAQLYFHKLANSLVKKHTVNVISLWDENKTNWLMGTTIKASGPVKKYELDSVPVYRLGFSRMEKLAMLPYVAAYYPMMRYSAAKIARIIEKKIAAENYPADLIHNVRIGREPISLASYNYSRKKNIPFFLTPVHHPRWKGWRYRVFHDLYRNADGIFALTKAEKEILIRCGVKESRIFVTGMGPILAENAAPARFIEKYKIGGPFVLFLGQHYEYKGYKQVLQSAKTVWEKHPEIHFVFIGPAINTSEEYFRNYRDPRIHRLGQISLEEKTDALAACAMLCVPSIQESFGGVYTEAWSFQKPVIGCPIPAVSEVIEDEVNGYLVQQKPDDIAERILYLFDNPSRAQQLGQAGFEKVVCCFTWERLAELTEAAYLKVIRG